MNIWQLLQFVYWFALCAVYLAVLMRGGRPEIFGMLLVTVGSILSTLLVSDLGLRFRNTESWMFAADVMMLITFVIFALMTTRYWPMWVASFQAITVLTHLAESALPNAVPRGYSLLQGFWVYPMFVAILLGAYGHQKARQLSED